MCQQVIVENDEVHFSFFTLYTATQPLVLFWGYCSSNIASKAVNIFLNLFLTFWQENYLNYRPSSVGKDDNGIKRMNSIARAAESIGDGDIFNVQIRKYRQWQLSQNSALSSCIIPYVFCSALGFKIISLFYFDLLIHVLIYLYSLLLQSGLLCYMGKGRHLSR